MTRFSSVVRSNQYRYFIIIILFTFFSFIIFIDQKHAISYEYIHSNFSDITKYERYCRQIDQRINLERISNISIQIDFNNESIPYSYSQWRSTSLMPRLLSQCEHAIYMDLLSMLIKNVFKKYNIQYMMMAATLLGSYTRHDLLPWDDDVDLLVSISDRYKLQAIIFKELSSEFYSINLIQMHNPRNYDKVFFSWGTKINRVPWRFPFIDIFYHDQNSTHVWLLGTPSNCPVRREDVFPLVLRPLGSIWLYGPREPMAQFESRKMRQIETGCYSFSYSHKYEKLIRNKTLYADCSQLKSVYPYVERQCTSNPISSYSLFSIQETLYILCDQFPLISIVNNSNLQCARLRIDQNVPASAFDLDRPTQIILFIIMDQPSSDLSPVDISINFNQSSYSPSSINDIRLSLLVPDSNFTINNQTTIEYTPYDIPIFQWQNSTENTYDLVDLLQIGEQDYETDTSLCKWNLDRWTRLFTGNMSSNVPYVYFLKTTNPQLTFTLIDTSNTSSLPSPLSPFLDILYCIPYRLQITEMVLIICFGVVFISIIIILGLFHYFKGGEDNRTRHFERYHHHRHSIHDKFSRNHSKKTRHRSSASMSSGDQKSETSY